MPKCFKCHDNKIMPDKVSPSLIHRWLCSYCRTPLSRYPEILPDGKVNWRKIGDENEINESNGI